MLNFIMRRRLLFAATALVLLLAALVGWLAAPVGPHFAASLAGAFLLIGLAVIAAVRLVFRALAKLKDENASLGGADVERLGVRPALAERRLAALAIKLDATGDLDEPKA